jgi:hypothetical protein
LGRVSFTSKPKPAKAEPVIDWSEIESRLQEISAPARASADLSDLPIEPSATLAHDPAVADDPPAASDLPETRDQPMNNSAIRSTRCLAGSHPIQTQNVFITILRHCKPGTRGAHFE